MEYIHMTYKTKRGGDNFVTIEDRVFEHRGKQILAQVNELDPHPVLSYMGRLQRIEVTEILEPPYASGNTNTEGRTRARQISDEEEQKAISERIRDLGMEGPVEFA